MLQRIWHYYRLYRNDQKLTTHLLPDYYGKVGKSEGRFGGSLLPQEIAWDFSRFTPELIVINLGTNDDSYTKDDPAKQADYAENYVAFLQKVRRNNPDSTILCTLGIMGTGCILSWSRRWTAMPGKPATAESR
ncbi:GDSL-type esterase/lipase family protein [Paenibacillus rhizoplanae]|uniref:GDSL-type esterase/lipase family protein n=1 Tax=Paenibacillus rhizoplanae TaxID=1917181 RepID=UPI00361A608E